MIDFEAQKIKGAIKDQLRLKKISYAELSEELDCSVPTIKQILGQEELTLKRLLQILQIVDLNLTELEMLTRKTQIKLEKFTAKQQEFLLNGKHYFAYLMKLFAGHTPGQIAEEFKLSERSTERRE